MREALLIQFDKDMSWTPLEDLAAFWRRFRRSMSMSMLVNVS